MRTITAAKPIEILLVEDSRGDIGLIEEVFEEGLCRLTWSTKDSRKKCFDPIVFFSGFGISRICTKPAYSQEFFRIFSEAKKSLIFLRVFPWFLKKQKEIPKNSPKNFF